MRPIATTAPRRSLCFDLENRPLAYWYEGECTSEITAFGWKWDDEERVQTFLLRADGWYESDDGTRVKYRLAHERFGAELESAGLVYGHNIRRHDLPMLQAWRVRLELPPFGVMLTTDTCRDMPKRKGLSYSLENLAEMYQLALPKHRMSQPAWERANQLRDSGIAEARKRVEGDVLLQEAVRRKLVRVGVLGRPKTWRP